MLNAITKLTNYHRPISRCWLVFLLRNNTLIGLPVQQVLMEWTHPSISASDVPGWYNHPTVVKQMGSPKMKINVLGIDLAKQVFQLHGVDEQGQAVLRKKLTRKKLLAFIAQLEPCLIGLEACSSANY